MISLLKSWSHIPCSATRISVKKSKIDKFFVFVFHQHLTWWSFSGWSYIFINKYFLELMYSQNYSYLLSKRTFPTYMSLSYFSARFSVSQKMFLELMLTILDLWAYCSKLLMLNWTVFFRLEYVILLDDLALKTILYLLKLGQISYIYVYHVHRKGNFH